jgi:transposase
MGDATTGNGVRIRRDMLAALARLAKGRRMGPIAPRTSAPTAEPVWTARLSPRKGGEATGPNPVDRGRPGNIVTDRRGIPLAFLLTGANVNDSVPFEPLLDAVPRVAGKRGRTRCRPSKLHADTAYDHRCCRRACHRRGIKPRIARRGVDTSQRLSCHRWVIERTFAWMNRFRRLSPRHLDALGG